MFGVSFMFPHNSVYSESINTLVLQFAASGLNLKISNDIAWDLQRTSTDALLDSTESKKFSFADVEERKLNLADTEGMFLLMAVGYIIGKVVGGNFCIFDIDKNFLARSWNECLFSRLCAGVRGGRRMCTQITCVRATPIGHDWDGHTEYGAASQLGSR